MPFRTSSSRNLLIAAAAIVAAIVAAWWFWPKLHRDPIPSPPTPSAPRVGVAMSEYIRRLGYRPLSIPRSEWGPGTVIRFEDGEERIVRFNEKCLKLKVPMLAADAKGTDDVQVADASLPEQSLAYDRLQSATGSVDFGKALDGNLNLSGALSDSAVSQIAITIGDAKQFVAAEGDVKDAVKAIRASAAACGDDLADPNDYIVLNALVIGKSRVAFIGKDGSELKINTDILKKVNASEDLIARTNGQSAITIADYRIVGYQLLRVGVASGSAQSLVTSHHLSLADMDALIARSTSKHH